MPRLHIKDLRQLAQAFDFTLHISQPGDGIARYSVRDSNRHNVVTVCGIRHLAIWLDGYAECRWQTK